MNERDVRWEGSEEWKALADEDRDAGEHDRVDEPGVQKRLDRRAAVDVHAAVAINLLILILVARG